MNESRASRSSRRSSHDTNSWKSKVEEEYTSLKENVRHTLAAELEKLSHAETLARFELQEELGRENAQLKRQLDVLQKMVDEQSGGNPLLEKELAELKRKHAIDKYTLEKERDDAVNELKYQREKFERQLSDKQDDLMEASLARERLEARLDEEKRARKRAEQAADQARQAVEELQRSLDHAQWELNELKAQHDRLSVQSVVSDATDRELHNLERERAKLLEEQGALRQSLGALEDRVDMLDRENGRLERENTKLGGDLREEVAAHRDTMREKDRLEMRLEEARAAKADRSPTRSRDYENLKDAHNDLRVEHARLKEEHRAKLGELETLKAIHEEMKQEEAVHPRDMHRPGMSPRDMHRPGVSSSSWRASPHLETASPPPAVERSLERAAARNVPAPPFEAEAAAVAQERAALARERAAFAQEQARAHEERKGEMHDLRERAHRAEQLADGAREDARAQVHEMRKEMGRLEAKCADAEAARKAAVKEAQQLEAATDQHQAVVETKMMQLAALQAQLSELERELVLLTAEKNALTQQVGEEKQKRQRIEEKARKSQMELSDLMQNADDKTRSLATQLKDLQYEYDQLARQQASAPELEEKVEALQNALRQTENGAKKLKTQNDNLRDSMDFKDSQVEASRQEAAALKRELDALQKQMRELEEAHRKSKSDAEKALSQQQIRLDDLEQQNASDWKKKHENLQQEYDDYYVESQQAQNALKIQLAHENEERMQLERRLNDEVELRALLEAKTAPRGGDNTSDALRSLRDDLTAEFARERKELEHQINQLMDERASLEAERNYHLNQAESATKSLNALEKEREKWDGVNSKKSTDLLAKLTSAEEKVDELTHENDELRSSSKKELRDLNIQLDLLRKERDHLESMLHNEAHLRANLEAELDRARGNASDSGLRKHEREEIKKQYAAMQAALEEQLADKKKEVQTLRKERAELAAQLRAESKTRIFAESQSLKLQSEAERLDKGLLAKVAELQNQLQDIKAQNEELRRSSEAEIKALKIQRDASQERVMELDRKLSQEVAARASLETTLEQPMYRSRRSEKG